MKKFYARVKDLTQKVERILEVTEEFLVMDLDQIKTWVDEAIEVNRELDKLDNDYYEVSSGFSECQKTIFNISLLNFADIVENRFRKIKWEEIQKVLNEEVNGFA